MSAIASRTLEVLSLFQAQKEWTGEALAARLAVSTRTVRRDIERLRELGYPVDAEKGPGGTYRLAPNSKLPPLIFDDDQAIAIALALHTAPSSVQDMGDSVERALRTITDLLPEHLTRRLKTFEVQTIENAWELAPPTISPALLAALSSAAEDREVVRFQYRASSGETADDLVVVAEPYKLVLWAARWYLVAYSQRQKAWHAYRLDRITDLSSPGWRFAPRRFPEADLTRFIQLQPDRGDPAGSWPCRGTVRMDCPVELVAKWAPGGATVEAIDERTTRISLGAWSWAGILGLLATFACDFVIEGPPELASAAGRMAGRIGRAGTVILPSDPASTPERPRVTSADERNRSTMSTPESRLAEAGIELPAPVAPLANYVPATSVGSLVFTAGQLPLVDGALLAEGKVGGAVLPTQAHAAARQSAVNALAAIKAEIGELSRVKRVVKVVVFVASEPNFTGQPAVADGASALMDLAFGEAGKHSRSAVGVSVLPKDAPVEVELIVEFE